MVMDVAQLKEYMEKFIRKIEEEIRTIKEKVKSPDWENISLGEAMAQLARQEVFEWCLKELQSPVYKETPTDVVPPEDFNPIRR